MNTNRENVIVSNPEALQETVKMVVMGTNDETVLRDAIQNPNVAKETLEAIVKRVEHLYTQGIIHQAQAAELVGSAELLLKSKAKGL